MTKGCINPNFCKSQKIKITICIPNCKKYTFSFKIDLPNKINEEFYGKLLILN